MDMEIVVAVAFAAAFFAVVGAAAAATNVGLKRDMKLESPGECHG